MPRYRILSSTTRTQRCCLVMPSRLAMRSVRVCTITSLSRKIGQARGISCIYIVEERSNDWQWMFTRTTATYPGLFSTIEYPVLQDPSRSPDLLERSGTRSRLVANLQSVQTIHVLFVQFKVQYFGDLLDTVARRGSGNWNYATRLALDSGQHLPLL
jgi:hypothetical protein